VIEEAVTPRRRLGRRVLVVAACLLLVAVVVVAVLAVWAVRRPFPQVDGTLSLAALDGPVDVYRDGFGVPTIVATRSLDLYRAQGFVHAQDRFWQMDTWRHIARGRTAELFGPSQLGTDRFLRTLGWERIAGAELELVSAATREILEAYSGGVNAYLETRSPGELAFEYTVLGLQNPGYEPRPWEPTDTLVFLKLMAWDLRGNMDAEIERAILVDRFGADETGALFPGHSRAPVIVADGIGEPAVSAAEASRAVGPAIARAGALGPLADRVAAVDALTGRAGEGLGSNSWVIAGEHTASGAPILANDPHLGIQMPSIWYQVALRCAERTPACTDDVAGFSFASVPGVVIGHNDRVAWGFTNLAADVMDLYVERVNPDDPDQYEFEGEWLDMDVVEETLRASDGTVETLEVRTTRHGPIVSDTYGPAGDLLGEDAPVDGPYALALRWTALDPGRTMDALPALNRAADWEGFRAAAALFEVPAQNLVYADIDGNIGYQAPGRIPIRSQGDGRLPVPGWTGEHEWDAFVPFEELPSVLNPESGWIVTANNPVAGEDYPHLLGTSWDHGFRAARLIELVGEGLGGVTLDDVEADQLDVVEPGASWLVPLLLAVDPAAHGLDAEDRGRVALAQESLGAWDGRAEASSSGAAVYQATWRHVLAGAFHPQLPEAYQPIGGSRWVEVVRRLAEHPRHTWWDDPVRAGRQERDDVLAEAMAAAVAEVSELLGDDPDRWRWGDLHTATFRNQTLGQSGVALVEARFNRGPYPVAGGPAIVNAIGWDARAGYEVNWLPSMRMIVDLGDLDRSRMVHTTGQSGHAYHRDYTSMIEHWQSGEQREPGWDLDRVARSAAAHLRLEP
jgi:penicillin amidase